MLYVLLLYDTTLVSLALLTMLRRRRRRRRLEHGERLACLGTSKKYANDAATADQERQLRLSLAMRGDSCVGLLASHSGLELAKCRREGEEAEQKNSARDTTELGLLLGGSASNFASHTTNSLSQLIASIEWW